MRGFVVRGLSVNTLYQTSISLRCLAVYGYEVSECHSILAMEDSCRGTASLFVVGRDMSFSKQANPLSTLGPI